MVKRHVILTLAFALMVGCAQTPAGDSDEGELAANECPGWKVAVIVNGRVQCVAEEVLDREQEAIELDDDW